MNVITIDKKEYVVIPKSEYEQLKKSLQPVSMKKLSLAEGKEHAYKLIDKWAKEGK